MMDYLFFIILGYLSGSIPYAYLLPLVFCHVDICKLSDDHNPGTANAFHYGGIKVGIAVILLELLKGFLPVFLAAIRLDIRHPLFALVVAAPVAGHAFPLGRVKRGGKSIAVSFGALLGLYPYLNPVLVLAALYLMFSLVIVIVPHFFRSIITYGCLCLYSLVNVDNPALLYGILLISFLVIGKHLEKFHGECLKIKMFRFGKEL